MQDPHRPLAQLSHILGFDEEQFAAFAHSQDAFESGAIHPSGRAGVPGPAAAPDMGRFRVDVGGQDVRLDFVRVHARAAGRPIHRVEHGEKLDRPFAVSQLGERHDAPDGCMGVLPAVFTHSGQIALDVAGIPACFVKRWREQQYEIVAGSNQIGVDSVHRAPCSGWIGRARQDAPALRDRVDTALGIARRPQRCSIIEVRAPIPGAVPCVGLRRRLQVCRARSPNRRLFCRATPHRKRCEVLKGRVKKPGQPHAFPLA